MSTIFQLIFLQQSKIQIFYIRAGGEGRVRASGEGGGVGGQVWLIRLPPSWWPARLNHTLLIDLDGCNVAAVDEVEVERFFHQEEMVRLIFQPIHFYGFQRNWKMLPCQWGSIRCTLVVRWQYLSQMKKSLVLKNRLFLE